VSTKARLLSVPAVLFASLALAGISAVATAADTRMVSDFGTVPESCVIAPNGKVYVSVTNEYDKYGDGYVGVVEGNTLKPVAKGLNDPHGLDFWKGALYNADNRGQVWKVGLDGTVTKVADSGMFPRKTTNFNDIEIDERNGDIYVSDSGDFEGRGGVIFKITQDGDVSEVFSDEEVGGWQLISPNGLLFEDPGNLLVLDWTTGNLHRLNLKTKSFVKLNGGWGPGDGLTWGPDGKLYVSAYYEGVYVLDKPDSEDRSKAYTLKDLGVTSTADINVSSDGKLLCVPDFDGRKVALVPLK
jgi:hypothetical protein